MSKAVVIQEFDINKIAYSKPKNYNGAQCINIVYPGSGYLHLQTPLMSSFGISKNQTDGKYSMTLILDVNSTEEDKEEVRTFEKVMRELQDKIIDDIVSDEKKEWKKILNLDNKYDKLNKEVKKLMIENKLGNKIVKEPKIKDKGYSNLMNVKIREYNSSLKVDTYLMNDKKNLYTENGQPKLYDAFKLLYREFQDKKPPVNVIGIITFSIWVLNGNIYISPSMTQVIVKEQQKISSKVSINEKGIDGFIEKDINSNSDDDEQEEEEVEEEEEVDDDEEQMPKVVRR
jgi:hypothetical protein